MHKSPDDDAAGRLPRITHRPRAGRLFIFKSQQALALVMFYAGRPMYINVSPLSLEG